MFVELTVITLVSSPAPSPLHTAEGKKQKTAAYIAEQTYLFFCKAKLLSIYHLLMYCIHFHCRCAGVYIPSQIKWEYTLNRYNRSHSLTPMDKNFEFPISLTCMNLDYEGKPK